MPCDCIINVYLSERAGVWGAADVIKKVSAVKLMLIQGIHLLYKIVCMQNDL